MFIFRFAFICTWILVIFILALIIILYYSYSDSLPICLFVHTFAYFYIRLFINLPMYTFAYSSYVYTYIYIYIYICPDSLQWFSFILLCCWMVPFITMWATPTSPSEAQDGSRRDGTPLYLMMAWWCNFFSTPSHPKKFWGCPRTWCDRWRGGWYVFGCNHWLVRLAPRSGKRNGAAGVLAGGGCSGSVLTW